MSETRLQFACGRYDRMEALRDGRVVPDGIALDYVAIDAPRETFDRAVGNGEFDMFEFSLSEFVRLEASGSNPYVAIPVFPSRMFRHGFIFVSRSSGIASPADLAGKRIGMGLYTQTASVWIRGHLQTQYGVDLSGVTWVQGAIEKPGAHGTPKSKAEIPPAVNVIDNDADKSLSELLAGGEIDALIGARVPDGFGENPNMVRLFPDYPAEERRFFGETRIFPIMHLVAIRREAYERSPWIAENLLAAFEQSKSAALRALHFSAAPKLMLPWMFAAVEEMHEVFDGDPWPYGVDRNRPTLEAAVRHLHEQKLIGQPIPVDDLFVPV